MGNLLLVWLAVASITYGGDAGDMGTQQSGETVGTHPEFIIPADAAFLNISDDEFPFVFNCPLVAVAPNLGDTALTSPMSYFVVPVSFEGRDGLTLNFDAQPVRAQTVTRLDGSVACRAMVPAPELEGLDAVEVVAQFSPGVFTAALIDSDGTEVAGYASSLTIRAELGVVIGNSANRTLVAGEGLTNHQLGNSADGGCGVISSYHSHSAKNILILFLVLMSLLFLVRLAYVHPSPMMKP